MVCANPVARVKEILKDKKQVRALYEDYIAEGVSMPSFRIFNAELRANRDKTAREASTFLGPAAKSVHVLDNVSKTYGLLCFSTTQGSILMWSHYCDDHCGIVIGFDATNAVFRGLKAVSYVTERVVFDAGWRVRDQRIYEFERKIVFSKNAEWSYEHEVRQFMLLRPLKQKPLKDGRQGYFLSIPPDAVVNVALGTRCTPQLEAKVRAALSNNPALKHVRLQRASLHESEFKMVIS